MLCEDLQLSVSTENYEKKNHTISDETINGIRFGNTKLRHWEEKIKTGRQKEIRHDSAENGCQELPIKVVKFDYLGRRFENSKIILWDSQHQGGHLVLCIWKSPQHYSILSIFHITN